MLWILSTVCNQPSPGRRSCITATRLLCKREPPLSHDCLRQARSARSSRLHGETHVMIGIFLAGPVKGLRISTALLGTACPYSSTLWAARWQETDHLAPWETKNCPACEAAPAVQAPKGNKTAWPYRCCLPRSPEQFLKCFVLPAEAFTSLN